MIVKTLDGAKDRIVILALFCLREENKDYFFGTVLAIKGAKVVKILFLW